MVTFRVPVAGRRPRSGAESGAESIEKRVIAALTAGTVSKSVIAARLGLETVTGQLNRVVLSMVRRGVIEFTIPEKLGSRLQKYRLAPGKKPS